MIGRRSNAVLRYTLALHFGGMIYLHGHLPTKMLRGALAFFARRKLQLKSRDPIACDRMYDLSIAAWKVNASNKIRQ